MLLQLASLPDVRRLHADVFLDLSALNGMLQGVLSTNEKMAGNQMKKARDVAIQMAERVERHCSELGLDSSYMGAVRLVHTVRNEDSTVRAISEMAAELERRLLDEMRGRLVFAIDRQHAEYYDTPNLFGDAVTTKFPNAIVDIEEAGKCLALDRGTACVFHLMRALEVALKEFATKLPVALPVTEKNWQKVLEAINGAIKRMPYTTTAEKDYVGQCSEIAIHLTHIKDAWRNDVMHPRDTYTREQAEEIFRSSKTFMQNLARFV